MAIMAFMSDSIKPLHVFELGTARVAIYNSAAQAGAAAAAQSSKLIQAAIAKQNVARVIGATGNSQITLVSALVEEPIDWESVEFFHMDEYAGMKADHPSSFRRWIKMRIEDKVHPRVTHYMEADAANVTAEIARYTQLLEAAPIDLAFVGFGENGHIAFNDPPVADFNDPAMIKIITLDEACRRQQFGEGHFADIVSVPEKAMTITCPGLFRAAAWVCCVPEERKAQAVRNALEGPISEKCPASLVRRHPNTFVYLDTDSASQLSLVEAGARSQR